MDIEALFGFLNFVPIPILISEEMGDGSSSASRVQRFLNDAFLEQIGYTMAEMPTIAHWFKLAYPDAATQQAMTEGWARAVEKSLAEGRATAEMDALVQCKNGQRRWFTVTVQLHSGTIPNLHIVTLRDIHELKTLAEENYRLSQTDPLTGMLNRRAGELRLAAEYSRFARGGRPFSVLMCDIDRFKAINDALGHAGGDHALCRVTETLRATCRDIDAVVRWGGEEFLLILPSTDLHAARALAERLRQTIAAMTLTWDGQKMLLTLSLGCAVSTIGQPITGLLKTADAALYQAKQTGRNKVCA